MKQAIEFVLRGAHADFRAAMATLSIDFGTDAAKTFVWSGAPHSSIRIDVHYIDNLVVDPGLIRDDGTVVRLTIMDGPHQRLRFWGDNPRPVADRMKAFWSGIRDKTAAQEARDKGLTVRTRDRLALYRRRPGFLGYTTAT